MNNVDSVNASSAVGGDILNWGSFSNALVKNPDESERGFGFLSENR